MPTTCRQRQLDMERVEHWGKQVEGASEEQVWQNQQRNTLQELRAVAQLAPEIGLSSSSKDVWENAQIPGSVLTLKRLFWQEHGVERRNVGIQTDPVAIMSPEELMGGEAEKVLAKELRLQHGVSQGTTFPEPITTVSYKPPQMKSRYCRAHSRYVTQANVPEVEIRVDAKSPRVERGSHPKISATAEELALEAGLAELTHESVNRGWGRRLECVLGTICEAAVPSFARFWEQDDPFGIITGGTK